jgi:hypothetical protein
MRTALLVLVSALAAGCPKPRTSAATQPMPAAFDPATSDAKALELADASLVALGGYDKWTKVKELRFGAKYTLDGDLKLWAIHQWDRWNGRHNLKNVDIASLASGQPDDMVVREVRYDLFDTSKKPYATFDGKDIMREDADKAAIDAKTRLNIEGYLITLPYRVRDPGVHLAATGPVKIEGLCEACETIKITYDSVVGKDIWTLSYDPTTKLPVAIGQEIPGKGLIGYKIDGWQDAGGLKFPAKLQNLGLAGEVWTFSDVGVGEPDDYDYVRAVGG